jgi:hypothetical protein
MLVSVLQRCETQKRVVHKVLETATYFVDWIMYLVLGLVM